jgi:hypothetical protein
VGAEVTTLPYAAELSVHRIGGPDQNNGYLWDRDYTTNDQIGSGQTVWVDGVRTASVGMRVSFQELADVGDGWVAGKMILADANACPIGRGPRPCLLYALPWDVPTMTHFADPWHGHYVVAVRAYGSAADALEAERKAERRREAAAHAAAVREP